MGAKLTYSVYLKREANFPYPIVTSCEHTVRAYNLVYTCTMKWPELQITCRTEPQAVVCGHVGMISPQPHLFQKPQT